MTLYQSRSLAHAVDSDSTGIYVVGSVSELELFPQWANCIGWYKVDEGTGAVITNSAPAGVSKLPDLDVVVPGSNFWGEYPGFGYWDGVATKVYKIFALPPDPLGTGPRTVMIFGREKHGLQNAKTAFLYNLEATDPGVQDYYSVVGNIWNLMKPNHVGDEITLSPGSAYYNKAFVSVFTLSAASLRTLKRKFSGGAWMVTSRIFASSPALTEIDMGNMMSASTYIWKGLLGDFIIWNVELTPAEIDSVVASYGARWGI